MITTVIKIPKEEFSLKDLGTKIVCKKKLGMADASVNTDKYFYESEEKNNCLKNKMAGDFQ